MNRSVVVALLVGALAVAGGYWWWSQSQEQAQPETPDTAVDYRDPTEQDKKETPEPPQYPLETAGGDTDSGSEASKTDDEASGDDEPKRKPLPPVAESDDEVRERLDALTGDVPIEGRLVPGRLIQKFVVWFNSLDGQIVPVTKWPVRHVPGRPLVEKVGEARFEWLPANAERYDPYVQAFLTPDAETLADFYLRYYPLLQNAFEALGEEENYFNDRMIAIIDHLLDAPPARERYLLVQPEVLYEFADPDLEALSSGQKIMLRLGPERSKAVREKLRAFRAEVLSRTSPQRANDANA